MCIIGNFAPVGTWLLGQGRACLSNSSTSFQARLSSVAARKRPGSTQSHKVRCHTVIPPPPSARPCVLHPLARTHPCTPPTQNQMARLAHGISAPTTAKAHPSVSHPTPFHRTPPPRPPRTNWLQDTTSAPAHPKKRPDPTQALAVCNHNDALDLGELSNLRANKTV